MLKPDRWGQLVRIEGYGSGVLILYEDGRTFMSKDLAEDEARSLVGRRLVSARLQLEKMSALADALGFYVTPGERLRACLEQHGMTQAELCRRIDRPRKTINMICQDVTAITAETALQLELAFKEPRAEDWAAWCAEHRVRQFRRARGVPSC